MLFPMFYNSGALSELQNMDATKKYPLSHGDKRTYELEDKEFWDDLFCVIRSTLDT